MNPYWINNVKVINSSPDIIKYIEGSVRTKIRFEYDEFPEHTLALIFLDDGSFKIGISLNAGIDISDTEVKMSKLKVATSARNWLSAHKLELAEYFRNTCCETKLILLVAL